MNILRAKTARLIAVNFELPADGTVPEWIQALPAGIEIVGRDGRSWINDRPEAVLAAFAVEGKDLPIDWEHASERKAPRGDEAPAAGWIKKLELRNGETWARVEWTARAIEQIRNREYRYISPVFLYEKESRRIVRITSAGLTNQPNLYLAAINQETIDKTLSEKEKNMDLAKLLAALGLAATATYEEALNRIAVLRQDLSTALNRAENPPLDKFVPRADYDKAVERAENAERILKQRDDADLEAAINTQIDAALKAGKITPATADYHRTQCRVEGGLERFKTFVAAAPVVGADADLDGKDPVGGGKALNAEEKDVIARLGISEEEYLKYNAA